MADNDALAQMSAVFKSQISFWDKPFGYTEEPQDQWSRWDVVNVDGRPLPGLGHVVISKKPRIRLQKRKQNGNDGDNPIMLGYDPAEIVIELSLWTPRQLLALQQFKVNAQIVSTNSGASIYQITRLLETPKLSKAQSNKLITVPSVHIDHPSLTLANISEMFIYSITPFEEGRAQGVKMIKIHGYERFEIPKDRSGQGKGGPPGSAIVGGLTVPPLALNQPTAAGYPPGRNLSNHSLQMDPVVAGYGYSKGLTPGTDPGFINPNP